MKSIRTVGLACAALFVLASASPADAQVIRSYGQDGSGGSSSSGTSGGGQVQTHIPGQPAPQTGGTTGGQAAQQQTQAAGGGEEGAGEDVIGPSHRFTVFSGKESDEGGRTTLDLALDKLYRGVIPGTRDDVDHLTEQKERGTDPAKVNRLTWLGFQPKEKSTRVFFQTAREADYDVQRGEDDTLVVRIENTKIAARNFRRFIDTSFFERNVMRVEAKQVTENVVEIAIQLQDFEQPTVQSDGTYVYLDFSYSPDKGGNQSGTAGSS